MRQDFAEEREMLASLENWQLAWECLRRNSEYKEFYDDLQAVLEYVPDHLFWFNMEDVFQVAARWSLSGGALQKEVIEACPHNEKIFQFLEKWPSAEDKLESFGLQEPVDYRRVGRDIDSPLIWRSDFCYRKDMVILPTISTRFMPEMSAEVEAQIVKLAELRWEESAQIRDEFFNKDIWLSYSKNEIRNELLPSNKRSVNNTASRGVVFRSEHSESIQREAVNDVIDSMEFKGKEKKGSVQKAKVPEYIQVFDLKQENKSWWEIAKALYPEDCADIENYSNDVRTGEKKNITSKFSGPSGKYKKAYRLIEEYEYKSLLPG